MTTIKLERKGKAPRPEPRNPNLKATLDAAWATSGNPSARDLSPQKAEAWFADHPGNPNKVKLGALKAYLLDRLVQNTEYGIEYAGGGPDVRRRILLILAADHPLLNLLASGLSAATPYLAPMARDLAGNLARRTRQMFASTKNLKTTRPKNNLQSFDKVVRRSNRLNGYNLDAPPDSLSEPNVTGYQSGAMSRHGTHSFSAVDIKQISTCLFPEQEPCRLYSSDEVDRTALAQASFSIDQALSTNGLSYMKLYVNRVATDGYLMTWNTGTLDLNSLGTASSSASGPYATSATSMSCLRVTGLSLTITPSASITTRQGVIHLAYRNQEDSAYTDYTKLVDLPNSPIYRRISADDMTGSMTWFPTGSTETKFYPPGAGNDNMSLIIAVTGGPPGVQLFSVMVSMTLEWVPVPTARLLTTLDYAKTAPATIPALAYLHNNYPSIRLAPFASRAGLVAGLREVSPAWDIIEYEDFCELVDRHASLTPNLNMMSTTPARGMTSSMVTLQHKMLINEAVPTGYMNADKLLAFVKSWAVAKGTITTTNPSPNLWRFTENATVNYCELLILTNCPSDPIIKNLSTYGTFQLLCINIGVLMSRRADLMPYNIESDTNTVASAFTTTLWSGQTKLLFTYNLTASQEKSHYDTPQPPKGMDYDLGYRSHPNPGPEVSSSEADEPDLPVPDIYLSQMLPNSSRDLCNVETIDDVTTVTSETLSNESPLHDNCCENSFGCPTETNELVKFVRAARKETFSTLTDTEFFRFVSSIIGSQTAQ